MFVYKNRYSILFKAITAVLVCLFIVNDIAWAQDLVHNPPKSSTLAPLVGNPLVYSAMKQMMIDKRASHQEPIDNAIERYAKGGRAKDLFSASDLIELRREFMDIIDACEAGNVISRLRETLRSRGGQVQVIFVKSEDELPVFEGKKVWGHAGTYVTVFALESEKNIKEGRRKIIGRLFHEIRARSTKAKELFDEEFKKQKPSIERIDVFIKSMQDRFESENLKIEDQIEQTGNIITSALREEFANLKFAAHPDVMNRDYVMGRKKTKPTKGSIRHTTPPLGDNEEPDNRDLQPPAAILSMLRIPLKAAQENSGLPTAGKNRTSPNATIKKLDEKTEASTSGRRMSEIFIGGIPRLQQIVWNNFPDVNSVNNEIMVFRGITFFKRLSGSHVIWAFKKNDINKVTRVLNLQIYDNLPILDQTTEISTRPNSLVDFFVGGNITLQRMVSDKLPKLESIKGSTIIFRSITFYKRLSGRYRVWAFKKDRIDKFARAFGLIIHREVSELDEKSEISIGSFGLERVFFGSRSTLRSRVTCRMPTFDAVKGKSTVFRGITLYKRLSGNHLVWALKKKDINKFARIFGLSRHGEIPKFDDRTEISASPGWLDKIFRGGRSKLQRIVKDNLPAFKDIKGETIVFGGVTLYKRLKGGHKIWALKKDNIDKFALTLGLKIRKKAPLLNEKTEISLGGKQPATLFVRGGERIRRDVIDKLPKAEDAESEKIDLRGISFYVRFNYTQFVWTIRKDDMAEFARAFGLKIRENIPVKLAQSSGLKIRRHIPHLDEVTEVLASGRWLDRIFVGGDKKLQDIVVDGLPKPTDIEGETVIIKGITFYKRMHGPHPPLWAFKKNDINKMASAFGLRIREKISRLDAEAEIPVSSNVLCEIFVEGARTILNTVINKLPNPNGMEQMTTKLRGVTFYKRLNKTRYTWALKRKDLDKFARTFGLVISKNIVPIDKATEISASGHSLYRFFRGGSQKLHQIVTDALPEFKDVKGTTTIFRGITFYKRLNGTLLTWAFKKRDLVVIAKAFGLKSKRVLNCKAARHTYTKEEMILLLEKEGLLAFACIAADQPEEFAAMVTNLLPEETINYEELLRSIWGFRQLNMAEVAMLHGFNLRHDRTTLLLDTFIQKAGLIAGIGEAEQQIFIRAFLRYSYKQFSKNTKKELARFNRKLKSYDNPFLAKLRERVNEEFTQAIEYRPAHVKGKLAPHEAIGAYRLRTNNRFALLDGTRVGKTRQALAALNPDYRTLVVSPASVIDTWLDEEGECFDPRLEYKYLSCDGSMAEVKEAVERAGRPDDGYIVAVLRGKPEDRRAMMAAIKSRKKIIIHVSMETLREMPTEEIDLLTDGLDASIIDEWQNVDNYFADGSPGAKQAAIIQKINPPVKWILSASPYRSDPHKLYSLFHYLLKDLPSAPQWAKENNGRLFRRTFTEDLQGLRMLNGELSRISLRRSMQDVWDTYDPEKPAADQPLSIPNLIKTDPSKAGAFEVSAEMAEAALRIIKNFRSYVTDVYNPSVSPEERLGKRKLNILIKLNFLRWLAVSCQRKRVGLQEDSRYWQELDKLVTEKMKKGEKIIIYAQNIFMVDELLERYKNYGCVRMDGEVAGWARDSEGRIIRGAFDKKRRFLIGAGSVPITAKNWARHRFQEDDSIRICVANIRAGIGLDLSRAESIIYAQLPTTYVEFYQSVSRALGVNPQHVRSAVETIFMTAKYPKTAIDKYASSDDGRYLSAGTVDEIQVKRLTAQDKLFSMVIEGIDPSYLEREEFYLLKHIPGFLEDMSLDMQNLTPRLRQAAETAMHLGDLYSIATPVQQDAIRTIIHDSYDTKIDLRPIGDAISGIEEFNPNDIMAIASISKSHNRMYKTKLFAALPEILKRVYERGCSLSEYAVRWNGGEEAPGHVIVAWLAAIPKDEEPVLSNVIGTLVEQCMDSPSNKSYLFQLLGESLVNFQNQNLKLLDNQRGILLNRRISLKIRLILLKKISQMAQLGAEPAEVQALLKSNFTGFNELSEKVNELRYMLLEKTIKKDIEIDVSAGALKTLEEQWEGLDTVLLFISSLKKGRDNAATAKNKEAQAIYEHDIKRFGEILSHIIGNDFSGWRNKQKGERHNGFVIDYLNGKEDFWEKWTAEDRAVFGNIIVGKDELIKQAVQTIFKLIGQYHIAASDGKWVSDRVDKFLRAVDKDAKYRVYEHEHKILGSLYNRIFNGKVLTAHDRKFIRAVMNIDPDTNRSVLMDAISERLDEYKYLKEWLDVITWAELKKEELPASVDLMIRRLGNISLRMKMIRGTNRVLDNIEDTMSLLTAYKRGAKKYEAVEVIITSNPRMMLNRGMLDAGLYNCFELDGDPRFVRALIDDLASRNKMLVIVKSGKRYEAAAIAKIKQDEAGAPVIFLERILHRKGGYNFQKEILDVLKKEKSEKLRQRPALAIAVSAGYEGAITFHSTGGYGEDEYSEAHHKLRRINHLNNDGTVSSYSYVTNAVIVRPAESSVAAQPVPAPAPRGSAYSVFAILKNHGPLALEKIQKIASIKTTRLIENDLEILMEAGVVVQPRTKYAINREIPAEKMERIERLLEKLYRRDNVTENSEGAGKQFAIQRLKEIIEFDAASFLRGRLDSSGKLIYPRQTMGDIQSLLLLESLETLYTTVSSNTDLHPDVRHDLLALLDKRIGSIGKAETAVATPQALPAAAPEGTTITQEQLSAFEEYWDTLELDMPQFITELSYILGLEIADTKHPIFVFSEAVAFDNNLARYLPKLAAKGIKVAVIARTKEQKALIDRLNEGKEKKIIQADSIYGVREAAAKVGLTMPRLYYFRMKDNNKDPKMEEPDITPFDLTPDMVKRIIGAIGKACRVEPEKLPILYELSRKSSEAA